MTAEDALATNHGEPVYAIHHGDLYKLWLRDDGMYVFEFSDLLDTRRRGTYVSHNLKWVLNRDRRYTAEWYCSELEARQGKVPEEFFIYSLSLYQHKETQEVIRVRFCNGEPIGIDHKTSSTRQLSIGFDREEMRDFLLNTNKYQWLTSWLVQTVKQSELDKAQIDRQAKRDRSYRYVYRNSKDEQEHDEYHARLEQVMHLAIAHFGGQKKQPLYVEGPGIGKVKLSSYRLVDGKVTIPALEKLLED